MEGRLALMARNLRENRRNAQKQKLDPGQDFFNLTMELQSQDERLAALQIQRDELLVGLRGLQESLKNQALRVTRLEGRINEVLQFNGGGKSRGSLNSNVTPQGYYETRRRSQAHRPGKILDGHTHPGPEGISYFQTDTSQSRHSQQPHQYQATLNQPKHSKAQSPRLQSESHPQVHIQYPDPTPLPLSTDYLPQHDPYSPQSQIQVRAQTRPYSAQQEQLQSRQTLPYPHTQIQQRSRPQTQRHRHHQLHKPSHPSWPQPQPLSQAPTHPETIKDRQSRTRLEAPQPHASDALPQPHSETYKQSLSRLEGEEEEESDTKVESSVIHNLLQLPMRQKIPAQPVPKKDATSK